MIDIVKQYVPADQRDRRLLIIGLMVALILRLGVSLILPPSFIYNAAGDSVLYQTLATNLLEAGTFGPELGVPSVRVPPIYSYFLAGVYAIFGPGVIYVQIVQAVLGALTCWLVFLLTGQIFADRRIAWLSFAAVIFHPVLVFWTTFRLTETVYTFLLIAFLLLFIKSLRSLQWDTSLLAGALWSVTLLTREVLMAYPMLVWPFSLKRHTWRDFVRHIFLFLVGAVVVLTPWTIRNIQAVDRFVIISQRTEHIRYLVGLAPQESPAYVDRQIPERRIDDPRYAYPSYMLNPLNIIQEPGEYIEKVWAKFAFLWLHPNGLESLPMAFLQTAYRCAHAVILLLATLGAIISVRKGNYLSWPLIILLIYGTLLHIFASTAVPRYTIPYLPSVCIFLSAGVTHYVNRLFKDNASYFKLRDEGAS